MRYGDKFGAVEQATVINFVVKPSIWGSAALVLQNLWVISFALTSNAVRFLRLLPIVEAGY
jgi:hypothetical protein